MTDLLPPPSPAPPPPPQPAERAASAPSQLGISQRHLATTVLASAVAIGVAVVARSLLGWHNPIVLVVVAYLAFLVVSLVRSGELADLRREATSRTAERPPVDVGAQAIIDLRGPVPGFTPPPSVTPEAEPESSAPEIPGVVDDDPDHDQPRTVRILTERDGWEAAAAVAAGLAVALTLRVLLDWGGIMSTAVWAYLVFVAVYFGLAWDRTRQEVASDRIITVLVWTASGLVLGGLVWMLAMLVIQGAPRLRPSFFTQDLSTVGPNDPGGGAFHAIIGTLEQVGIAVVIVMPIAVLTAVYLHELKGRLAPAIRFVVDAMSGLPSIVAGLLVFTVWVNGRGFSGIAGSAALVILMLPTVTRTSEEILRTIPDNLREASLALGAPQWRVVLKVVVPTAMTGLVTAAILGVARAIGETAPMLLTAFGQDSTNTNPFSGPQSDLPLFVWKLIRVPNETQNQRAWTGALVLVLLVLFLFVTARFITSRAQKRLGRAR
ncbi:MAG: phosphate ABC transporter permease PstA [Acidimicrobiales bacterium]